MKQIEAFLAQEAKRIQRIAIDIVEETVLEAEERMIEILESAVTKTGLERAKQGGHPGRVDTGNMRDAIQSFFDMAAGGGITGDWGWLNDVAEYYIAQEYGGNMPSGFVPMRALQQSFVEAREKMIERLIEAGFEVD